VCREKRFEKSDSDIRAFTGVGREGGLREQKNNMAGKKGAILF
jgi:hypothetical protein